MIIGDIDKSQSEKIRLTIEEYKGYRFINLRICFLNSKGVWHPTKKGITLRADLIEEVIRLFKRTARELKKTGYVRKQ